MTVRQKNILDTLSYHNLFDFPLTAHEICLMLPVEGKLSQQSVFVELHALKEEGVIGSNDGLWFLNGCDEIVEKRKKRFNLAEKKFLIAKRFFSVARYAPFLRAVYVCNTLARSNAREGSDIDLFIVTSSNRIWLTRLFVTGLAKILHVRPNHSTAKDKICLSFFNAENALNLRGHAIKDDVYLPHWLMDLYPIYDESGISGKIFAENTWARDHVSGLHKHIGSARRSIRENKGLVKRLIENLLDKNGLENSAKKFQLRIMPKILTENAQEDNGVVINDSTLKLHGLDRRAVIRERYQSAISVYQEEQRTQYARTI